MRLHRSLSCPQSLRGTNVPPPARPQPRTPSDFSSSSDSDAEKLESESESEDSGAPLSDGDPTFYDLRSNSPYRY